MTEDERQTVVRTAINLWMPLGWPNGGSRFTLTSVIPTGDVDSGGVDVEVDKDGDVATIQFTNTECYGESAISFAAALQRVHTATYA